MNIQPMILDLNSLRPSGQGNSPQINGKKEEAFSFVLDQSRKKQEEPIKQKVNKYTEASNKRVNEKPMMDSKKPISSQTDKAVEADPTDQTTEITSEDKVIAKEKTDEAMKAVADVLGISVQELEKILAVMQMGLSDLLKGNNLQELIMEVHGTEEPMDLLLIPELAGDIKKVTQIIEDYAAELTKLGVEVKFAQVLQSETGAQVKQTPDQPADQGTNQMIQKNTGEVVRVKTESEGLQAEGELEIGATTVSQDHEVMQQNQEQFTQNGNNPANQFLDNLSQSMGDVLRTQNNQVNESFETIITKADPVNPRMVLDQIIEKVKVSSLENEAKMMIQLKPEHLGKLSMEVVSKQGVMTAHILVENEKTKALLEQNIQGLRDDLEEKGIVIQELEVTVGQNQNEDRPAYENRKSNKNMSDMISRMMNEEALEEVATSDSLPISDANEVDFIA